MEQTTANQTVISQTTNISPTNFKSFLKQLCIVTKKHQEREFAKLRLKQQLQNVKNASLAKTPKRWVVEGELKKIEYKLADVLAKETEILSIGREDSMIVKELKDKIQKLEFQLNEALSRAKNYEWQRLEDNKKIEQLNNALLEIKEKIGSLKAKKEKKTKRTIPKNQALMSKIKMLGNKYQRMKRAGNLSKAQLIRLENRINLLKERLRQSR